MIRKARPVQWFKAVRKDFQDFPKGARDRLFDALTVAAYGGYPAVAQPWVGVGPGVMELALRRLGDAFQKKSKSEIETPM